MDAGVATRRGVMAIHREPAYRDHLPKAVLPVTEAAARETLLLPIYTGMTEVERDYVIDHLPRALHS